MNVNDMIKLVIGVILGVLMVSAILVPVLGEATTTEKTFTNNGLFYVDASNDELTVEYDNTTPSVITINNEAITIPSGYDATLLFTEDSMLRFIKSNSTVVTRGTLGGAVAKTISLTYSEGTVTGTVVNTSNVTSSISGTYTELAHIATEADRIMTAPTDQYVLGDSEIEAFGQVYAPGLDNANSLVHIVGTVADGVTIDVYNTGTGEEISTIQISNISINAEEVGGYVNLYKLTSITFTMTEGTATYNATFNIYTIPSEVTAELSSHLTNDEITLLNVIPMLITVGIIVGIVGVAFSRRE